MFKKKKKKQKIPEKDQDQGWLDQELHEENREQVEKVLRIMKNPSLFWEVKVHSHAVHVGKDHQVELQLNESESRFTLQPPGFGDDAAPEEPHGKKGKAAIPGLRSKVRTVFLVDVLDFVRGQSLFRRKKKLQQYKALSMSIVFSTVGNETEQVDLYADLTLQGELTLMAWKKGLTYLMRNAITKFEVNPMPILLERAWFQAGGGPGVLLGMKGVDDYLRDNNMVAKKNDLKRAFQSADADKSGKLGEFEFCKVVQAVSEVGPCHKVYDMVTKSKRVKADALYYFHTEIQKDERITIEECHRQIRLMTNASAGLTYEDFCTFLTSSKLNSAMEHHAHSVYQNMTYPFANYFISTTRVPHTEVIETVSIALDEGCRAFHVEIYAQGGEPSLFNPGGAVSSHQLEQIEMADLLSHFRDKAFLVSKYPVILILELHCRESAQDKLAAMLKTYLGFGLSKDFRQATPQDCMERFLIAVDVTHALEGESTTVSKPLQDLALFDFQPFKNGLVAMRKKFEEDKKMKGKQIAAMKDYQLSLNMERDAFQEFNCQILSYFVPKNDKVNQFSSDAWASGTQMVAVNYLNTKKGKGYTPQEIQEDHHRLAQLGRFRQNGRCGYVLKPHTLRPHHVEQYERIRKERQLQAEKLKDAALGSNFTDLAEEKDPQEVDDVFDYADGTGSCIIKIRLISAHRLPKGVAEISSVYVFIKLVGEPDDEKDYRSAVVEENGLKPEFTDSFEFKLERKEFDILCFKVFEKGVVEDYLLCQSAVPLACLRQGYRCLELRDSDGRRIASFPTLFMHIDMEECGDFQSLKLQELRQAERQQRLRDQRRRLEGEFENVQTAITNCVVKQTALARECRSHRQALKNYDQERLLGCVWVNQQMVREAIGAVEGGSVALLRGWEEAEDKEAQQAKDKEQVQPRRLLFRYEEEAPFDEPARTCECVIL